VCNAAASAVDAEIADDDDDDKDDPDKEAWFGKDQMLM